MKEIKKVELMPVAKMSAAFGILIGFFTGVLYAILGYSGQLSAEIGAGFPQAILSPWAILYMPLFYGVVYFLGGVVFTLLYNLFASKIGGVKIQI